MGKRDTQQHKDNLVTATLEYAWLNNNAAWAVAKWIASWRERGLSDVELAHIIFRETETLLELKGATA